jgi:hypothetical protein
LSFGGSCRSKIWFGLSTNILKLELLWLHMKFVGHIRQEKHGRDGCPRDQ